MEQLPFYIYLVFGLTTALTVWLFLRAAHFSVRSLTVLLLWIAAQAAISLSGFYKITDSIPPRFAALIVPPLLLIAALFATKRGRHFIDCLDLKKLTLLHIIRIPVEVVLLWLCLQGLIPRLMTFEGYNFDILSGLSAVAMYYAAFPKGHVRKRLLIIWNFICLALLINIVVLAVLSAPSPAQRLAFSQPNVAISYFPFVWLPCCIVPLVMLAHLAAIRQLLKR